MRTNQNPKSGDRHWNSQKFIELSHNLANAYGPGLDSDKSDKKADFWTVDKLISMSRHLGSAYGVDF